ncbi:MULTISPECIES: hypothetical protein [Paraburkholderia]|uniref:hypothetical protein n=1 Tax=Paraburkholderia TaxID=1822464 RepID=UPI0038B7CBF2
MTPHYSALIDLGKALAQEKGLQWDMPLDETGAASDGVGWNLTIIAGDVPPPTHYLRDLGTEVKALAMVNSERAKQGLAPLAKRPLSAAWQDLVKATVAEQLLFRRNTTGYVAQCIARPLRIIAKCVDRQSWELTADDLRAAIRTGSAIQAPASSVI